LEHLIEFLENKDAKKSKVYSQLKCSDKELDIVWGIVRSLVYHADECPMTLCKISPEECPNTNCANADNDDMMDLYLAQHMGCWRQWVNEQIIKEEA